MHMSLLIRWLAFQSRTQWVIPTSQDKTLRHRIFLIASRTSMQTQECVLKYQKKAAKRNRLIYFMAPLSAQFVDFTKSRRLLVVSECLVHLKSGSAMSTKWLKASRILPSAINQIPCFNVHSNMCVTRSLCNIHDPSHAHRRTTAIPQVQP